MINHKAMLYISWTRISLLWFLGLFLNVPVHAQVAARIGFNGNVLGIGTILNVCANSVLTFSDSSLNASGRLWVFKQGNPSQSQLSALSVSFSIPGTDSVILRAWSGVDTASTFLRVNVFTQIDAGVVGNTQNVCFGARPDTLRYLIAPSGGGGSYNFQWQISTDSTNYVNVPSATNSNFRPDTLRLSRYFRVIVNSRIGCGSDTSNAVFIRVWNDLTAPLINGNRSICFNTSTTLQRTQVATGGDGNFTYQWQRFDAGGWVNLAGQTVDSLVTGNLTQSTSYRLRATSTFGCGDRFSDSIRITVFASVAAGIITTNQNICFGSRPDTLRIGVLPSGGGNAFSYQWQVSTDSLNFVSIAGANSQQFRPDTLQLTRFYRLIVTSTLNCGSDSSNVVRILVYRPFGGGSITGNDTICFNTRPDTMRLANLPIGGNGVYNYQWLTSNDNVSWSAVPGQTGTVFRPGNLTSNRFYRLLMQSGVGCGSDTSNTVKIAINPLPDTTQILGEVNVCRNQVDVLYRLAKDTALYSYQWYISKGQITSGMFTPTVYVDWGNYSGNDTLRIKQTNRLTGCTNEMFLQITFKAEVAPNRAIIIKKPNSNILICNDSIAGTIYQWGWVKKNDLSIYLIPNSNHQYVLLPHIFDSSAYIYFVITRRNSCDTKSYMNFSPVIPTTVNPEFTVIKVYPNPTHDGMFKIETQCEEIAELTIYDSMGKLTPISRESQGFLELIQLNKVTKGIYFGQIQFKAGKFRLFKILVK
jgi:hypothetical protein